MPSVFTVVSSLLVPAGAVLAGSFVEIESHVRRDPCKTTYYSQNDDTCKTMDTKYGLQDGSILAANPFLTCSDVWVGTPICVPDGPYAQGAQPCSQTYNSQQGDTCDSIDNMYGLQKGATLAANTFLTCDDIWANTPICVPNGGSTPTTPTTTTPAPGSTPTPANCKSTYNSVPNDTCDSIENAYNLQSNTIKSANSFVDCTNIWAGTPLCIPDGPYKENLGCTIQTYYSQEGDNCDNIESKNALVQGDVKQDNPFVDCNNIWAGTPLIICVPPQADHGCTKTINSWDCATCDDIGATYGVSASQIQAWNTFVDCNDIWSNTPICVAH